MLSNPRPNADFLRLGSALSIPEQACATGNLLVAPSFTGGAMDYSNPRAVAMHLRWLYSQRYSLRASPSTPKLFLCVVYLSNASFEKDSVEKERLLDLQKAIQKH